MASYEGRWTTVRVEVDDSQAAHAEYRGAATAMYLGSRSSLSRRKHLACEIDKVQDGLV